MEQETMDLDKVLKKFDINLLELPNGVKAELAGIDGVEFTASAPTSHEAIKLALEAADEDPLEFAL
jgi:hypothetical protein